MRPHLHLGHLRPPRKWLNLGSRQTVLVAAALFGTFYAIQAQATSPADALEVLYVVPIALLAVRFGLRGGLSGAIVGVGLILVYNAATGVFDASWAGEVGWVVAFVLLGTLLGTYVEHRRRLEAVLTDYFDGSLDLLATADASGRLTRVNPSWERTLGHTAETMCSRPFIDFVHPDDRAATLAEHAAVSQGSRDAVGFRNRYRAADGGYRWLEWTAHTELTGAIHAVARDVTAQHDAEQQLADHAHVLENAVAERTRELEEARAKTLHRLVLAAEFRDDDTFHHTERVASTSASIAARLGLGAKEIEILREAALLHDVGKIAIPDSILFNPGKLSAEEYEVMKTHTTLGAKLLTGSGSPVLQMGTLIAESHHERWDGNGYPHRTAGETIPLIGRIVAVADVFDALTHERPYKRAWPLQQALDEIERGAGSQFDPRVVEAFLASHRPAAKQADSHPPRTARRRMRTHSAVDA
ncbi:MAG TPA: HD domain-containing phosphohydrolase [Solirubrobacteraceae bacterium]|nr:HD domain-containing phosphohydrolase [Solirubrobacteraceae bacterium]